MKIFIFAAALTILAACGGKAKKGTSGDGTEAASGVQIVALSDSLIKHRRADTLDFGRVRAGEQVTREFRLRNAADKALVVTQVDLSCGCVQAEYPREPLMPGAEAAMALTLDTRDLSGRVYKTVGVRTSLSPQAYTLLVIAEVD